MGFNFFTKMLIKSFQKLEMWEKFTKMTPGSEKL